MDTYEDNCSLPDSIMKVEVKEVKNTTLTEDESPYVSINFARQLSERRGSKVKEGRFKMYK